MLLFLLDRDEEELDEEEEEELEEEDDLVEVFSAISFISMESLSISSGLPRTAVLSDFGTTVSEEFVASVWLPLMVLMFSLL